MKVTHNDETVELAESLNVWDFLSLREVKHPKYVVFEMDGEIVPQEDWSSTLVTEDAEIETAYLSGGG